MRTQQDLQFVIRPPPGSGLGATAVTLPGPFTADSSATVVAPAAVTLSGIVKDRDGDPIVGIGVHLTDSSNVQVEDGTDSNGAYSLEVAPGTYELGLSGNGLPGLPGGVEGISTSITLTDDRQEDLTIENRILTLKVTDPHGNPVDGVQVQQQGGPVLSFDLFPGGPITGGTFLHADGTTDANGEVRLNILRTLQDLDYVFRPPGIELPPQRNNLAGPFASDRTMTVVLSPVLGESVFVNTAAGEVTVKTPASSSFVPLEEAELIPVGSQVDARAGTFELTSATGPATASSAVVVAAATPTQTALFRGSLYRVTQPKVAGAYTDLSMIGPLVGCASNASASASARPRAEVARRAKIARYSWGKGHGKFRQRGRKGSGSARGTTWKVSDRCDGKTVIHSIQGTVLARDFVRTRTRVLHTGESYVAPGPKRRRRRR